MYEIFEHTADLGLRIRAQDLPTLFAEAGKALFSVLVENLEAVQPNEVRFIRLKSDNLEYLLFDWLDCLLYLFDAQKLVLADFQVSITAVPETSVKPPEGQDISASQPAERDNSAGGTWRLQAIARGEKLDRHRHMLDHEVKAITYHALKLEHTTAGWLAEVIVDI